MIIASYRVPESTDDFYRMLRLFLEDAFGSDACLNEGEDGDLQIDFLNVPDVSMRMRTFFITVEDAETNLRRTHLEAARGDDDGQAADDQDEDEEDHGEDWKEPHGRFTYRWNYLAHTENGQKFCQIAILCSPGDWLEIRKGLSGPQSWDKHGRHAIVHDASTWMTARLGVQLVAVSPSFPVVEFPVVDNRSDGEDDDPPIKFNVSPN